MWWGRKVRSGAVPARCGGPPDRCGRAGPGPGKAPRGARVRSQRFANLIPWTLQRPCAPAPWPPVMTLMMLLMSSPARADLPATMATTPARAWSVIETLGLYVILPVCCSWSSPAWSWCSTGPRQTDTTRPTSTSSPTHGPRPDRTRWFDRPRAPALPPVRAHAVPEVRGAPSAFPALAPPAGLPPPPARADTAVTPGSPAPVTVTPPSRPAASAAGRPGGRPRRRPARTGRCSPPPGRRPPPVDQPQPLPR